MKFQPMETETEDSRVKKKVISWKDFAFTYVIMLLVVGIQMGIIIAPIFEQCNSFVRVTVIMLYWCLVATVFLCVTRWQIKVTYDTPMRRLSDAAKKVASGDFSVYVEPVHTPDKYDYIDVMFTDFNKMVQELGSIETLKNDFVANVSHEIKTPLAVIKNYTVLLRDSELPESVRLEYMNTINNSIDNLSALVSNVLRLNKIENQEIEPSMEKYDICGQLSECILSFESLLDDKNIEVIADIEDRAIITADKDILEIVWNNILSNAIKFTDVGGTVSITQTSDTDVITVAISDTGCGMSEDTMKRIFDKFYQGDTSHFGAGNGLGLALCQRIIEKMDGTISVTSEIGKGSTFTVTIPIKY